jgi:hypothetical protein
MTPSQSRSASPSDQDDANNSNSTARDEEVSDEVLHRHCNHVFLLALVVHSLLVLFEGGK